MTALCRLVDTGVMAVIITAVVQAEDAGQASVAVRCTRFSSVCGAELPRAHESVAHDRHSSGARLPVLLVRRWECSLNIY